MRETFLQNTAAGIFMSLLVACSSGCDATHLFAWPSSHLAYNEARDEFHHLRVYRNISATRVATGKEGTPEFVSGERRRAEALDYLAALWRNREDLIVWPNMLSPAVGAEEQFLYLGPREFRVVSLGSRGAEPKVSPAPFDLDRIRIQPGEFFLSPEKTLCYSHGCTVPGALIDDMLNQLSREGNDKALDELSARRRARSEKKETRIPWSDLRATCLKEKTSFERLTALGMWIGGSLLSLDDASIRLLIRQSSGHELRVRRKGLEFSTRVQLSPDDAKEFAAGFERILDGKLPAAAPLKDAGGRLVESHQREVANVEAWTAALRRGTQLTLQEDGWLMASLNFGPIMEAFETTQGFALKLDAAAIREGKEDVASLEERGIPINKNLTLEAVQKNFRTSAK